MVGAFYICNMIKGKKKEFLTPETILSKISEYDIFRYYMPNREWRLNQVTYSPFREERHPSFIIGNKKGYISFIDFADTDKRGNCFDFVKCLFNIHNFYDVLTKIDVDFGLGISSGEVKDYSALVSSYKQPIVTKKDTLIQVITRKFTKEELSYWNDYHQDIQDLRDNNVFSIKKVYLNKQLYSLNDNELRFGYFYDGYWKIYRPFGDKLSKWTPNNVPITKMDGLQDIANCNVAFINKSKKDYMVMKKVFPCSCAVQNEGIACFSHENVEYLKANSNRQILSFDSDVTGVKNSQQITQIFNFGYCNVPRKYLEEGIKDWAALGAKYGLNKIEEILKQKNLL